MLNSTAAEKYDVPKNIISIWQASKTQIINTFESGDINPERRCVKSAQFEDMDKTLYTWFLSARRKHINEQILNEKVKQYASFLDVTDFVASNGWFDRCKLRHIVSPKQYQVKTAHVNWE